jgi:dynein heavy chain
MPEIDEKSTATQEMVKDLEIQSKDAAEIEKTTAVEEAASKKIYTAVMVIKTDCETILGEAMPALNKALAALDTLKKADIDEMKAYAKPPDDLVLVLDGVGLLLGKNKGWDNAKIMMSNPNAFISELVNYDKTKITDKMHKAIKKFTNDDRFDPEKIAKKSGAGKSLCSFVCAMDKYTEVSKIVAPKKLALAQAEKELEVAQNDLKGKQAALQLVRNKIHALQNNYKMSQQTLEELNKQKETTELQLGRAEKLVNGLADEAVRWGESIVILETELINMMGNVVLGAGFISYVGTFTQEYRNDMMKSWMKYMSENNMPY